MPFIGQEPLVGGYHVLDNITTSSTNTYNLALGGVAFSPESANHLLVSLNGVIQKPGGAFSVGGSQITFIPSSGTLSNSDSIDFIIALGDALNIGTPSDNTITTAKIMDNAVVSTKIANDAVTGAKIAPTITTNHTFSGTLAVPAATSGWRHIKTLSGADVSSVQFLHGVNGVVFDDTYDVYEFIVHYWYATSSGSEMRVEPSQDGSSFTTTNTIGYTAGGYHSSGSNSVWNTNFGATSGFYKSSISGGVGQTQIFGGQIRVFSPFDSSKNTVAISSMGGRNNTDYFITNEFGGMSVAGRTHGLQFDQEGGGNIHTKISLYGIKDS